MPMDIEICDLPNSADKGSTVHVEMNEALEVELDVKEKLVSPSPTVIAEIAGVRIGCVLDTGAEASVIPSHIFHSQLKTELGKVSPMNVSMKVIGVAGTEIPVEGYVRTSVSMDGREAVVGFLVVQQESSGSRHKDFLFFLGVMPSEHSFNMKKDMENFS